MPVHSSSACIATLKLPSSAMLFFLGFLNAIYNLIQPTYSFLHAFFFLKPWTVKKTNKNDWPLIVALAFSEITSFYQIFLLFLMVTTWQQTFLQAKMEIIETGSFSRPSMWFFFSPWAVPHLVAHFSDFAIKTSAWICFPVPLLLLFFKKISLGVGEGLQFSHFKPKRKGWGGEMAQINKGKKCLWSKQ